MKKYISLILAAALLSASLTACGGSSDVKPAGDTAPQDVPEIDAAETADPNPDNLPEMDFSGKVFQMYCRSCCASHKDGMWQAEATGDIVSDAVYERNKKVEERFNVVIAEPKLSDGEDTSVITNALLAGDCMADVIIPHFRFLGDMVLKQLMYDMAKLEYLDFSRPWWNTKLINNYSIFGRSFVAYGNLDVENTTEASTILFNKKLKADYLPDDNYYSDVKSGKWTIDRMNEVVHSFGADINGDGAIDADNDLFALSGNAGYMFLYQVAMDQPTTRPNEDGEPELCINTEKMATIVQKMYNMVCEYEFSKVDNDTSEGLFINGRSLFTTTKLNVCIGQALRRMEDDYGILPLPKYDEQQTEYYSHGGAHSNMIGIPAIEPDLEFVSITLEAMCAEGYKIIQPVVYDVALKQKGARDDDSGEMIDIICSGRTGDFADLYDEWGLVYTLDNMIGRQKKDNFASYYKSNEKASVKRLQNAVNLFKEMP
ncbi:MAG: hypothetical protein K6D94_00240 [Clostridiales bacterium]|nr:hypothetical protein [Clostridiales bacterium]